ncbi:MAG: glycosyltransferase, partial [Phycisphaerales bacterium JB038]
MRVKMFPDIDMFGESEGGIRRVVEAYHEYAQPGIDYVGVDELDYDLIAVHAGATTDIPHDKPFVLHLHGLYWTGDYEAARHEYKENAALVHNLRLADVVTVPSHFVARSLRRDMRLEPIIASHGIKAREWVYRGPKEDYILWNKNRTGDVCSPEPVSELARRFRKQRFVTTFADEQGTRLPNVTVTGTMPHAEMRPLVQKSAVYLATTQETFGIGVLEAMAAGTPILGFRQGALPEIVNRNCGYLAKPGDYDDLAHGLEVIRENYAAMSRACVNVAMTYDWAFATERVRDAYKIAVARFNQPHTYSVVIPVYNKAHTVEQTIRSVQMQTVSPDEIIVVDNNSTDDSYNVVSRLADEDKRIVIVNEPRQGVAHARNRGCGNATSRYVVCLDGDDEIDPTFGEKCLATLRHNRDVGVAYTKLRVVDGDTRKDATWPPEYQYDGFLRRFNQVPTCAMFRRELWERLGGYRQRYAPRGAGSEDAEFWLRMGAIGYRGMRVDETLFSYHTGGATSHPEYAEKDWLGWHPWTRDNLHPFASCASPVNHISHPVRSYDNPMVSVVIPVSPDHLELVMDALDSLEAQTFRNWEVIVMLDGDNAAV